MNDELQMDDIDRDLLKLIQIDFPLVPRPYLALGVSLGLSESEVILRVERLRFQGVIREISAIFDSRRLGYRSLLVAMQVPPGQLVQVGQGASALPEVSHCYARDHRYNLWFTLTTPPNVEPEGSARALQRAYGVENILLLPALRRFKIGVSFDVAQGAALGNWPGISSNSTSSKTERRPPSPGATGGGEGSRGSAAANPRALTDLEWGLVRELQRDLSSEPRPFLAPASSLGMGEEQLLAHLSDLQTRGLVRRFAAVLRHRAVGFLANGMSCWIIPPDMVEEVGEKMARWPSVTHCYQRPTYPDWPYCLFGMLHARSRDECLQDAADISAHLGLSEYSVLFSYLEFKKERVRYFAPQL